MEDLYKFLMEMDKLKGITRKSYIFDNNRKENSAEHSWHLALAILAIKEEFKIDIDLLKAVKMALVHDICEIEAGDVSVYSPDRSKHRIYEKEYIEKLTSQTDLKFAPEIKELWKEFENLSSKESIWVKIVDRLLPFMMNLNTQGKTWKEQGVTKSQVLKINKFIESEAPEIYEWMLDKIEKACKSGWLIDL